MLEHPNLYSLVRDREVMVKDYWNMAGSQGYWNVDLHRGLNDWEVEDLARLLGKVDPFSLREDVVDHLRWIHASSGIFSVKTFREAQRVDEAPPNRLWTDIWKLHLPSKIVFFLWILLKRRLPTIDLFRKRGLIVPNICSLCMGDAESIEHLFIHCPYGLEIWERLLNEVGVS